MWNEDDKRNNAIEIMKGNIDRDPVGSKLTPAARQEAAEFAADNWKGNMGNGEASKIGIRHVTSSILKHR